MTKRSGRRSPWRDGGTMVSREQAQARPEERIERQVKANLYEPRNRADGGEPALVVIEEDYEGCNQTLLVTFEGQLLGGHLSGGVYRIGDVHLGFPVALPRGSEYAARAGRGGR